MKKNHLIIIAIAIVIVVVYVIIKRKNKNETINNDLVYTPNNKPSDVVSDEPINLVGKSVYANKNNVPVLNTDWSLSKKASINEFLGQITGEQSKYFYKAINTVGKTVYFAKNDVKL